MQLDLLLTYKALAAAALLATTGAALAQDAAALRQQALAAT